jgi:hypothetical protein
MDNNVSLDSSWIPEGYMEIIGPNGQKYLVPRFYAPALTTELVGIEKKRNLEIEKAAGTVSFLNYVNWSHGKRRPILSIVPIVKERPRHLG